MVIVERKRTPNKNKQFTELHNIGNENCPPWMSCTIVRVFILKAHILFHSIQVEFEKENLGFSFSNSTNRVLKYRTFWPSQNTNRRKENREFENCDKKLPMPSHHCVTTVTEIWQEYSEAHIFSTCFVGSTGWNSWLQNSNLCVLVCQRSLTEKTHSDIKNWLVEMLSKPRFTHRTGLQLTLKAKKRLPHLKIPTTTKPKNTQGYWLGTTTLLLFRKTHTGNHTNNWGRQRPPQSPFFCNPTLNEEQERMEYSKMFQVSSFLNFQTSHDPPAKPHFISKHGFRTPAHPSAQQRFKGRQAGRETDSKTK